MIIIIDEYVPAENMLQSILHKLSVIQYVKLEKKAKALGKTVPEYLSFFISKRVGTTQSGLAALVA